MNKLMLLASFCIGATPALGLVRSNINLPANNLKIDNEKYKSLEIEVDEIVNDLISKSPDLQNKNNTQIIRNSISGILNEIKNNNVEIEDVNEYLLSTNSEFRKEYESSFAKSISNLNEYHTKLTNNELQVKLKSSKNYEDLEEAMYAARVTTITSISAASIVAASLYATAALSIGATLPSAISATAVATGLGAFLLVLDSTIASVKNGTESEKEDAVRSLKNGLTIVSGILTASAVLYPPAEATAAAFVLLFTIINVLM